MTPDSDPLAPATNVMACDGLQIYDPLTTDHLDLADQLELHFTLRRSALSRW